MNLRIFPPLLLCLMGCIEPIASHAQAVTPLFDGAPTSGNAFVDVLGDSNDVITIYQIDPSGAPASGQPCASIDSSQRTILQSITSGTTGSTATLGTTGSNRIALVLPLAAGAGLCLKSGTAAVAADNKESILVYVKDGSDFGRVRTFMTLGVQISNQQPPTATGTGTSSSNSSSTAGEYLEVGFASTLRKAPERATSSSLAKYLPGIQTIFDVRMSPVPVSAPATNTSTTTNTTNGTAPTTTTTTTVSSLNLLTSQQSARVQTQVYLPSRLSTWQNGYNVFTVAPLAKAGFTTLLNPTTTSASQGITTTTTFSPTYSFFGYGSRFAWDQYPKDPDKAPQMVTQLDVTMAKYSSLPSYLCTSNTANTTVTSIPGLTPGTNTACGSGTGPFKPLTQISRTLAYRLDINAIAKLPGYPFVVGVNANLAQYTIGHNANIDYFNKAGNDIRIFLGVTIPFSSLGSLLTTGSIAK